MNGTRVVPAVVVFFASLAGAAAANPGDFDPTFNGGAPLLLDLSPTASTGTGLQAVQLDGAGRIVVAGLTTDENNLIAVALARLLSDGSLDQSFGDGGKMVNQAGRGSGTVFSMLGSLMPRPGGGWIGTGGASGSDGRQAVLVLATDTDGHLDLNFGTGGSTRFQAAGASPAYTLAFRGGGHGSVATDGGIFVGHTIFTGVMGSPPDTRLVVVALTPAGEPANGFASMGVYTNTFSQTTALTTYGWAALRTADGILATGSTLDTGGRTALVLVRLTAGGVLDGAFAGGAGYRVVQASDPVAPVDFSQGTALALGPGGDIYVAITANDADGHSALGVARFDAGGTLDGTFGDGGIARVQTAVADPGATPGAFSGGLAVQADGSALVIGSSGSGSYTEMVVVRLTPAGDVDPTFGTGGVLRIQPSTGPEPETFGFDGVIAPDGKTLVAVGQTRQAVGGRGVVARIELTTTVPDPCAPADSVTDALCRLRALRDLVSALTPAGSLQSKLIGTTTNAEARLQDAASLTGRARKKKLKKALQVVVRFEKIVRSRRGRRVYSAEQIATLTAQTGEIERIVGGLRRSS